MSNERELPGPGSKSDTLTLERQKVKRPRRYAVLMHNDDYTTQEFVVHVLKKFFHKDSAEAATIMMTVHTQGKAKVGSYTKDIAETKVHVVMNYARQHDMPLLLTAEAE